MKIKTLFLLLACSSYSTYYGMKRAAETQLVQPTNKQCKTTTQKSNLQQSPSQKPVHLHEFFGIHPQRDTKIFNNEQVKLLIHELPQEIKTFIALNTISKIIPWWYLEKKNNFNHSIYALSFHPHDNTLAISVQNEIKIINPETMETVHSIDTGDRIYSLTYSSDGKYLAYGLRNGKLEILTSDKYESFFIKDTHMPVWSVCFSPNSKKIAFGSAYTHSPNLQVLTIQNDKLLYSRKNYHMTYGLFFINNRRLFYSQSRALKNINTKKNTDGPCKTYDDNCIFTTSYNDDHYAISYNISCSTYIVNHKTDEVTARFITPTDPFSVALDKKNEKLAIGLSNGPLLIFKHYTNPTPMQTLLRELLSLWILIEKPDKAITSPKALLEHLSHYRTLTWHHKKNNNSTIKHKRTVWYLDKNEIIRTWNSLPSVIRNHLWHKMNNLIQTYGK